MEERKDSNNQHLNSIEMPITYKKSKNQLSGMQKMKQSHHLTNRFKNRRPLLNVVLDGFGIGKNDYTNAVFQANTPYFDYLYQNFASTQLLTHGKNVGLPGVDDLGGSEVGHLTMGAGVLIDQGSTLISKAIKDGSFFEQVVLKKAMTIASKSKLHLIGLLSDGNVHSHIDHFKAVIESAVKSGVTNCHVHILLDGRDVGIQTADIYISELELLFKNILKDHPDWDYGIVSGGGREIITMDRDKNWDKVEAGWNTHVLGKSGNNFKSANEAVSHFRNQIENLIDQDCPPFNIFNKNETLVQIEDNDAVLFLNFRADRAIEITQAFVEKDFSGFKIDHRPDVYFAGMMIYDEDNNIPENIIMQSPSVDNPFGKRILELGLKQFRLTETQKYAHVTFFFNGGYKNPLDPSQETYHLISSDKIASFAEAPQMKAMEIAAQAVDFIESDEYDFGLINFANADMVGHTGNMEAAIKAVETVDTALKMICQAMEKKGGLVVITADHGNADEMLIVNKKTGKEELSTKHSINPVPFIIFDPSYQNEYQLLKLEPDNPLNLSMIAATNFILLGQDVPEGLSPSLFEFQ
jgi:2,3-bisphosphoglycerate-independent phosphoglycerate mutase